MGAWGPGPFQNDQALAWLAEVEEQDDPTLIDDAVDAIVEAGDDDHLDADDCQAAIAAAEVVAAMGGKPSPRLPDEIGEWAGEQEAPDDDLVQQAVAAIARIRTNSELREAFTEEGTVDAGWLRSLDDLVARLSLATTADD